MLHKPNLRAPGSKTLPDATLSAPPAAVRSYDHLSHAELVALLERRDREKSRLGLNWAGDRVDRDAALNDDFVALRLLPKLSHPSKVWPNLLIEGDNFDALRWLRMTMRARFRCIYVDPPYNTGASDWVYNDRFHTNGEFFNTTWLEFLHRRFLLARDLLTEDGVLLVSINDENRAILEMMLDQTLPGMRVGSFVWRTKDTGNDSGHRLSQVHEHILVYGRSNFNFNGKAVGYDKYRNPDNDARGAWAPRPITKAHTYLKRENTYYPIQNPDTGYWYPCDPNNVWRYATEKNVKQGQKLRSDTIEAMLAKKLIYFPPVKEEDVFLFKTKAALVAAIKAGKGPILPKKKTPLLNLDLPDLDFWVGKQIAPGRPSFKDHMGRRSPAEMIAPVSSWIAGMNEDAEEEIESLQDSAQLRSPRGGVGTDDLVNIMGSKVFDFPKPVSLLKALIAQCTDDNSLVLDFFAGSGTTAEAVMSLNEETDGNRRFVLVSHDEATVDNPERNLARDVMRERVSRLSERLTEEGSNTKAPAAYARTHIIPIDRILDGDNLTPEDVWLAVLAMHDLPLSRYSSRAPVQKAMNGNTCVAFVDVMSANAISSLKADAEKGFGLIVYTWTPGPIVRELDGYPVEIQRLPQALTDRFRS